MEAKISVELWESEIGAGPFCSRVGQIPSKKWQYDLSTLLAIFFFLLHIWKNEHF